MILQYIQKPQRGDILEYLLILIVFDYSTYIFFNFVPMFFMNQIGSALHGKNYLYVELGVGISHGFGFIPQLRCWL